MRTLKVLLVTPQLAFGGAEVYLVNLANELRNRGHEVIVVSSGGKLVSRLYNDIPHYYAPLNKKNIRGLLKSIFLLWKISANNDVDLIHCQSVFSGLVSKLSTLFRDVPIVCTAHGWSDSKYRYVAKGLDSVAQKVIAVSEAVAQKLKNNGVSKEKIKVIYNGIDINLFTILDEARKEVRQEFGISLSDPVVVTVARLVPVKGINVLLDASLHLKKEFSGIKFLVVGDGPQREELVRQSKLYGLESTVIWLGERHDIGRILAAGDVFCLPSLSEGFPISILEAMAAEMPVVASNVGGVSEMVIDGQTGFIVEPNNVKQLVNRLSYLLKNESYIKRLGKNGAKRARLFTTKKLAERTEELYFDIMKALE